MKQHKYSFEAFEDKSKLFERPPNWLELGPNIRGDLDDIETPDVIFIPMIVFKGREIPLLENEEPQVMVGFVDINVAADYLVEYFADQGCVTVACDLKAHTFEESLELVKAYNKSALNVYNTPTRAERFTA